MNDLSFLPRQGCVITTGREIAILSATYTHHRVHCNENLKPVLNVSMDKLNFAYCYFHLTSIRTTNHLLLHDIISFSSRQPHRCCELQKNQTRPNFDDHIAIQTIHDSQPVLIPSIHFSTKQPDISLTI